MATTLSHSLSSDLQLHHLSHFKSYTTPFLNPKKAHPRVIFPKSGLDNNLILCSSTSQSSSSSSSSTFSSTLLETLQTGRFLSNEEIEKLQFLENFRYYQELGSGSMWVRVMREEEMDMTVGLLADSFAESMLMPKGYVNLLGILVKQYMIERRILMPHTATLIGFYKGDNEDAEEELAGTVEISFNRRGVNASPPTPTPPKNSPYICNMTVQKSLRRRGIGWHLLKASEELISQMTSSREVYLHCRMIDAAPFNMYTKAGYSIVKTDNIFILLTLQRRKHLMLKKLPVSSISSETDVSDSNGNHHTEAAMQKLGNTF